MSISTRLSAAAPIVLPSLARLVFAAVLARYFLNSALTKLDGFGLSANAYIQIVPQAMERAGYDPSSISILNHMVAYGGTAAEFILPVLIILGLCTRLAALAMAGFILVMSWTDRLGHHVDDATFGAWFDGASGSLIMDQRSLWMLLLAILFWLGAGPLALDRFYKNAA